jgi:hypothetical protein
MSALATAAMALARRGAQAQARGSQAPAGAAGLSVPALLPLAHAVLPAELGAPGIERAATAFSRWIGGYREGEELLHPYGSERLSATGPSPAPKWAAQLVALNNEGTARHGRPFRDLTLDQRTDVVQGVLDGVQYTARVPAPLAAPHVALALVAHFLQSPEATNLAYLREIDAKKCRPLAASPNVPVTLRRGGRA